MNKKPIQPELFEDPAFSDRLLTPDEIFDRADEELLKSLSESRRIERKPALFGSELIGDYVCMWANTAPDGGILVCGMADDGGFEGCLKLSVKQVNDREKAGYVYCPDAHVNVKQLRIKNIKSEDDFVLLYRVHYCRDSVVKTVGGKVFVRKGDSKIELKGEAIRELKADKGEVSFEQQTCGLKFPDLFKDSAIAQFVTRVKKARRLDDRLTVTEVLSLRRLGEAIDGVFVPNIACMLLFGKDPARVIPGCKIRFQRFEGEHERTGDKYNAVKDEIYEGCVAELIAQVEASLDSQLRTFSPLDAKGKFYPVPEYPKMAWYETIVNACVHRSYGNGMKNMPIFVKMFDDRLVVESPGPFPPFVTPDNIYDMHQPRNPQLMDALFYLEYVRCAHEGTRRIRDSMAEWKLPAPEFKQSEIGHSIVRVTLRNNIKQRRAWIDKDVSSLVSEAIAADLAEEDKRVLNFAAEHGRITVSEAGKLLDISWQTAKNRLIHLAQKRILQYIRFRAYEKDMRDQKAYFRLRSSTPLPKGAFEQKDLGDEA